MRKLVLNLAVFLLAPAVLASGMAEHVVVVVWDGMRPDFISTNHTPVLEKLAREGVMFKDHHAVFCSATEVNAVAIATGMNPAHSGIIANNDYLPAIRLLKSVTTTTPGVVARGDKLTDGKFLQCPTLAETLQAAGKTTAIAGSKTVALLHDRSQRTGFADSVVYRGNSRSPELQELLDGGLDEFPELSPDRENKPRDEWTRRTLTEILWTNGVPTFSLLWLCEPDISQHAAGPGSERALAAMKSSDEQLGAVLDELEKRNLRDKTDVFVVSDHGFSTVRGSVDTAKVLREAGFNAQRKFKSAPQAGDIMVIGQGGSVLFYVIGHDKSVTHKLVQVLQLQDFSGVLFTREKMDGTFPLAAANIDREQNPPDVVLSLRWLDRKNKAGVAGVFRMDSELKPVAGTHASLSRFDLHNTLVADGPDLKTNFSDTLPTGNIDLAPTILWLLGVKQTTPMDGRVLSEALGVAAPEVGEPVTQRLEASSGRWHQYLKTSRVNETVYLDEGNGEVKTK